MFRATATPGRLDAVLAAAASIPRADVQRAIGEGRVRVDGVPRPKSFRLQGGERIEADLESIVPLAPEPGGVRVRYEDERLLVVVKPAGVLTHPTARRREGTLVNRLLGMGLPLASAAGAERPGIVHRLDAGTSGLLVVAKDDAAYRALVRMFGERLVHREYLALVRGVMANDAFEVEAPLGKRGARVVVTPVTGAESATEFETLERFARSTLVLARPRTGRTHQIRVHLASIGHPILGDRPYGGWGEDARALGLERPFLHACRLKFEHPMSRRPIDVLEPLPQDLERVLNRLRGANQQG
ncbi:MAG: RluA family pseudouridine synthase [Actinomycetota bacterium]